jgi:hypothetical protein
VSFLVDVLHKSNDPERVKQALDAYHVYLESVGQLLPKAAYEFAAAPWHYDYSDRRCPHDSWVESLLIQEPSSGDRKEIRKVEISIRLLAAFHDCYLELSYKDVHSYSIFGNVSATRSAHGDWLTDEVRLSDRKLVLHEILFSSGSRWAIECGDLKFQQLHL